MVRRLHWPKLIAATAAACLTLSTYTIAGPRSGGTRDYSRGSTTNSGSRFDSATNSGSPDSQFGDNSSSSGFDRERSRDQGSELGRTRATDGTDATDTSESERSKADQAGGKSAEHRNSGSGFIHRTNDEQVVETHDAKGKTGETESSRHQSERSEVSKKFDSSLLFAGVTPAPRATSGGGADTKGPMNNPGLEHMSQQGLESSEAGRTTAQNAIDEQGSAKPATPPGHHYGWRRGEHNPHATVEHRRLRERRLARLKEFLRENLTPREEKAVKELLGGDLTDRQEERLKEFLRGNLTPREEEALKILVGHFRDRE